MLANYNGKEYRYDAHRGLIKTEDYNKTDDSFSLDMRFGNFYKKVNPSEIKDIYHKRVYAVYDTGIEGLDNEWFLCGDWGLEFYAGISEDTVKIVYVGDILSDWDPAEGPNCTLTVKKTDLEGAGLEYKYFKKDGKEYDPPLIEKAPIEVDEISKYWDYFRYYL